MFDDEVGRVIELLAVILEVSEVPVSEIEDWAELRPGFLGRMLKGEKGIPLRNLFLMLECVMFSPRNFFSLSGLPPEKGISWRQQVLRELKEIGYESVMMPPRDIPGGKQR